MCVNRLLKQCSSFQKAVYAHCGTGARTMRGTESAGCRCGTLGSVLPSVRFSNVWSTSNVGKVHTRRERFIVDCPQEKRTWGRRWAQLRSSAVAWLRCGGSVAPANKHAVYVAAANKRAGTVAGSGCGKQRRSPIDFEARKTPAVFLTRVPRGRDAWPRSRWR